MSDPESALVAALTSGADPVALPRAAAEQILSRLRGDAVQLYGEFDRPATEPVVGGRDAQGRTFLEVALEEMEIEADTLADLQQR